jgi:hypothetical protein
MSPTAATNVAATISLTPGRVINRLTSGLDIRVQQERHDGRWPQDEAEPQGWLIPGCV